MDLKLLTLDDQDIFRKFLPHGACPLSAYSFVQLWIWRDIFKIFWGELEGALCVFFENEVGCFMGLPPLGGEPRRGVVDDCFAFMEERNNGSLVSRIENVVVEESGFFTKMGFRLFEKGREYVVRRMDIVDYKGGRWRHQRALRNFHQKNYGSIFRDYREEDKKRVLELCRSWRAMRLEKNPDRIYGAMLSDNEAAFARLLEDSQALDVRVKVLETGGKVIGVTTGFGLESKVFCVNFEVTDLSYKGAAAYLFSAFASSLDGFEEINMMDDSGIESLQVSKMRFRPLRMPASLTVTR